MRLVVASERIPPGMRINIRTPNAIAVLRGTSLVTEVLRAGSCEAWPVGVATRFTVLSGTVEIAPVDPAMGSPRRSLGARQSVTITSCAVPNELQYLSEEEAQAMADSFNIKRP
jgi:hypothetical protein